MEVLVILGSHEGNGGDHADHYSLGVPMRRQPHHSQTAVHRAALDPRRRRTTTILRAPILPPYYKQLLETAERYRHQGEHEVAVIVAQTACELVTESAFETFFRAHGSTEPDKKNLRPRSYDLNNPRVKALYVLLSKDKIQDKPFWTGFTDHVKLRHGIVHKGKRATAQEAEASLRAATDLIAHVEAVIASASGAT